MDGHSGLTSLNQEIIVVVVIEAGSVVDGAEVVVDV
jgi:hypothetical protein